MRRSARISVSRFRVKVSTSLNILGAALEKMYIVSIEIFSSLLLNVVEFKAIGSPVFLKVVFAGQVPMRRPGKKKIFKCLKKSCL